MIAMATQAVGTDETRTPASWLAKQFRLWSRTLEPVRPLHAPAGRVTARDSSWPLAHELTSVGRARRLVTAQAGEWGFGDLADTVELLVSELVTNALRHARGPVRLNLRVQDVFRGHGRAGQEGDRPRRFAAAGPVRREGFGRDAVLTTVIRLLPTRRVHKPRAPYE
ncbi:ATP-binding protein [Actinacidiphila glaucinigra]|uniref:ATP-binding protein n=1 Tax=Actinacidiphila glaucinigra TaxID=235986 RepID=UPI0037C97DD9